jgi:hypothetical protein
MNAQEIRDLFQKHKISLSRDDVWEVQGNPVVKHQALERLSSALRIIWHKPEVLRSERDEAVLIVTGNLPSGPSEWSIGEAVIGQNLLARNKTAIYPYAMAEKRAKDRVILKLAGLYGSHSEEEADDFKQEPPQTISIEGYNQEGDGGPMMINDSRSIYVKNSLKLIPQFGNSHELSMWLDREAEKVWPQYGITEHHDDGKTIIMACKKRRLELKQREAA